jgi:hypothetical protein
MVIPPAWYLMGRILKVLTLLLGMLIQKLMINGQVLLTDLIQQGFW